MNVLPNIPPQNQEDPNSYFVTDINGSRENLLTKSAPFFQKFQYYAIKVWPWINRALTAIFYFIFGLIKTIVKMAVDQIKNFRA